MTSYNLKNNRPTIAVMTNMMASPFSEGLIFGASDYAKLHHYNVICFSGAAFAKPSPINMSRHRIFDLIDTSLIDGIIVPIGSLSRFLSEEEQVEYLNSFSDIPVVTVASYIPGFMDVGYSPKQGILELVAHLKEQHGVERFAFAGATGIHRSTIVKKEMLVEAIESHGLSFDEEFFIKSDTSLHAHIPGLEMLFSKEKHLRPQAIVAGTDNLARTVLMALKRMGIRVPEDVIVTGSMGCDNTLFTEPPLTSIVEPTYELGWHAAERLLAAIEGNPFKESLVLPTSIEIRQSCGCDASGCHAISLPKIEQHYAGDYLALSNVRSQLDIVLSQARSEIRTNIDADIAKVLTDLLIEDLSTPESKRLLSYLKSKFEVAFKTEEIFLWAQFSLCIHRFLIERISAENVSNIEIQLASDLFTIVQFCHEKSNKYKKFEAEKYVGIMREIGIQLNSELNLDEISLLLAHGFNITDYYINVFEDVENPDSLITNMMAMRDNRRLDVLCSPFPPKQLLPKELEPYDEVYSLLVMPLSFQEEFLGFCVFSMGERKGVVYEGLLTLFSSAIKNEIHVRNLQEAEKKFSDIAHSASDWLWEIDNHGCFTYCSEGVQKVLGYSPQMLMGRPLVDLLDRPNSSYVKELMLSMNAHNGLVAYESCYLHCDGRKRILLTTGKPILKLGRIVGYRGAYKDISEIKAQEVRIKTLAYYDPLTNLPNRTLCNDKLQELVEESRENDFEFAVLFIDLDGFKLVNDSMGHNAGDILLRSVATLFSECIREDDMLARFGGDEFVIVLPNIDDITVATRVAEKMANVLSSPIEIDGQSIFITSSIGISIYPSDGDTAETLLINADKAMYRVKQSGKNRFAYYKPELEDSLRRTVLVRNLLHCALIEDNFELLFQPLINSKSGKVSGVEALVRFGESKQEPDIFEIGPDEFIPIAEEVGLIEQIGLWVFKKACQQQRRWSEAGISLKCAINVSAKQFRNPNLGTVFISLIEDAGIDPELITIEITENAVINNEERARVILQQLSDYGLSIAIDDFGTGYASLSCLRQMPIDTLKIDRSFVKNCTTNDENAKIIEAIIMMAKSLKLSIVAEGVETQDEFEFLTGLGGDTIQGYLFAKPLRADEIPQFLSNNTLAVTS